MTNFDSYGISLLRDSEAERERERADPTSDGSMMLGRSLASPLLANDYAIRFCFTTPDIIIAAPNIRDLHVNCLSQNLNRAACAPSTSKKKWVLHSTAKFESVTLTDDDRKTLEACRDALSALSISNEEGDKILGKAFGLIPSPYWGEERKNKIPKFEIVCEKMGYLRSLNLSNDDLSKLLKKFPEVLGCDLEHELKTNVQVLEKQWGIKGKSLRNLLLRNPRVLGYNVDCKGDCMAQCTRCWVRF